MTIPLSTVSYNHYAGDDSLAVYPVTFPTYENDTIKIYVTQRFVENPTTVEELLAEGTLVPLVLNTDYVILNLAKPNTAVSLLDASDVPPGWSGPIPERQAWIDENGFLRSGYQLLIEFITNPMRPSTLVHGNQLVPALTKDLDRLTMHVKALDHLLKRTVIKQNIILENLNSDTGVPGEPGDYLEYDNNAELVSRSGVFSGYSATLGRNVTTTSLTDAINQLFDWEFLSPTLVLNFLGVGAGPFEKGVLLNVSEIQAVISQGTAELGVLVINAITGPGALGIPDGPWNFSAPADFNTTGGSTLTTGDGPWDITDSVTVSGTLTDDESMTSTHSRTLNFVYPKYYGKTVDPASEAQVKALSKMLHTSRAGSLAAPAGVNFIHYAYPASYGDLTSITHSAAPSTNTLSGNWTKTVVNFTMADGASVPYNIYVTNTVSTTTTGTFTFS